MSYNPASSTVHITLWNLLLWTTTVSSFLSMLAYQAFTRKDHLCSKYLMDFQVQSSKYLQWLPSNQFQKYMNHVLRGLSQKMAPLLVPVFCIIYLCCWYSLKINKKHKTKTDKRKAWSIFFHTALEYSPSWFNWSKNLRQIATFWWKSVNKGNEHLVSDHFFLLIQSRQQLQLKWVFPTQHTMKSSDEAYPAVRHLSTIKFRSHQDINQY